jgi:hypothetical protein
MFHWKCAAMAACAMVWSCSVMAQPVYKWVDAQGKTHYTAQPPEAQPDAAPLKITPNGSTGGSGSGGRRSGGYNADGTKQVPREVREVEAGLEKRLRQVDAKTEPLDCAAAVSNIRSQAETMIEVGRKNQQDGYMTAAQFETTRAKIQKNLNETTQGDCQAATGGKQAFYQCMSSSRNHFLGCAQKHRP